MYTAPEIINNLEYDEKSDIWSIGIIIYELYFSIFLSEMKVLIKKEK
jgi:serine/threonine protein kinase